MRPFVVHGQEGDTVRREPVTQSRPPETALATSAETIPPAPGVWQPLGPVQVNTSAWNLVTGSVTSIAVDPSDLGGNTVYLGTDGGGVWKSGNAAGSSADVAFRPLTDAISVFSSASLSSLSIGAVSVQPGGTGVVLAGTGNPNNAIDSWYGVGILRSTDSGNTWNLINTAGNTFSGAGIVYNFVGSAFSGFAWSTTTPNFVVAAVADSAYGEVHGIVHTLSALGLYYSSDAGQTWQLATLEDGSQVFESNQITQNGGNAATAVVWNPVRRRFFAAIRYHGYYESPDGMTWTRLANQPGANLTTSVCPANPILPGSAACPLFRGALAAQPATGDLFALTVDAYNRDQGLWRDVCNLTSGACASSSVQFGTQIADTPLQSGSSGTIAQASFNLYLAAVPSQQDTLLFAGTADIWRCSLDSSCTWRNATNTQGCAAAHVAPAQEAIDGTFGAGGLLYFGNEGGLWRSTDGVNQQALACSSDDAAHFQNLNGGIGSLAQVDSFSEDPENAATWLVALGEMGTAAPGSTAGIWNQVLNGEGDETAIDPVNPANWYATSVFGVGVNRCTEGTNCNIAVFGSVAVGAAQVDNDQQSIAAPWILDPADTSNLILGTCRVWRGPASGTGWSKSNLLSGMLDGVQNGFCNGNAEIRSLAAAPNSAGGSGAEQLYAGMAGVYDGGGLIPGHVFTAAVNSNSAANTQWTDISASPVTNHVSAGAQFNSAGFDISSVYADPHDATGQTIYVTVQGSSSVVVSSPLVYRSTDAGAHWSDITANLAPAPANSIVVDPNNANVIYVALDTGAYFTENVGSCTLTGAQCWNVYGSGLPNAPVMRLMVYNQGATQELRAATHGRGVWEVPLATAGVVSTNAVLSPNILTFQAQQLQTTSASQTVTLTNTGGADLSVAGITMTGDFTETDSCSGQTIVPAGSCSLQVSFAPSQTGSAAGTMSVFANVDGGQLTATMTGTGLPAATIVLTPSSLAFGGATVGSLSAPQYVTIANTAREPASLTGETLSGDYSLSANTCGSSLLPNNSCTVGIIFTPTVAGPRNGSLTVTDTQGTQTAMLSGTGQVVATDALTPLSLIFAAQQVGTTSTAQPVTLTNTGDQALTGIAVIVTGDFAVANNCGAVLQAHGSCAISVAYAPTMIGGEAGSLKVTDELRSQAVSLSGTGVAPPGPSATPVSIDFGDYAVGSTSSARTVTITNNGASSLTNLKAAVSAGFAIASNNCPSTLTVGSACQIGVTFSPAALGAATGTLTVSASNLSAPLVVSLSGFGADFSMAVTGSASSVIASGQTATFALQLEGLAGSTGTVALTCAGAPKDAQCSLNPSSMTVTSLNTSSVTVSIATGVSSSAALRRNVGWPVAVSGLAVAMPLCWAGFRRRSPRWILLLIAALGLMIAGCSVTSSAGSGASGSSSVSGGSQNLTPFGTYPITITGTLSNITHSVQVNVTVQ
jgi:hypothetical protein